MKKVFLIYCFFIPFIAFAASKTDSVINIDKIPKDGILLNKGWKFHAGDISGWGKAEVDDSNWEAINPATDIYYLPQVRKAEIGWFRLKMHIDTSLVNQSLAFNIYQAGASEIYLNGRLVYSLGKVNKDYSKEKTQQTFGFPFALKFDKRATQVIAVRYSFNRRNFFINYVSPNLCLQLTLNNANKAFANYQYDYNTNAFRELVLTTLFLLLGSMSLVLYFSFRIQKAYLYLGVYGFIAALASICALLALTLQQPSTSLVSLFFFGTHIFTIGCSLALAQGVYLICEKRKGLSYYIMVIYAVFSILAIFFLYSWSAFVSFFFVVIFSAGLLPVLFKSARNKIHGTLLLLIAVFGVLVMNVLFLFEFAAGNLQIALYAILFAFFIVPLTLSFYIAGNYARTARSLQARVIEVEQLSEKTIAQEQWKQEILATQNQTLELQVTERTAELNQSLTNLKATQTQLIQSEKMASLGELTAGIAHEIQNPLNFVNNFSEVNTELIDELKQEILAGNFEEVNAIADDIKENQQKINMHGKRADGIVKGMLQHSQSGAGKKEPININALAEECMRLSYHGLRAKDKSFNAEMVTNFDPDLPKINVVQQDIGRVFLNLFNNAFYAVNQKQKTIGADYRPEVTVSTSAENGKVIINVKDNGTGIPDAIKEKIMQPFFTTKPTGEGTGLGLSLTYDMVVKGHGGTIAVAGKEGEGSEFTISLPIN